MVTKKSGRVCKLCQSKFMTLKDYQIFSEAMSDKDEMNEVLCCQLFEIQQKGLSFE